MKKYFMYAVAAVATMSLASCMNEEDMFKNKDTGTGEGYISLNVSADRTLATRTVQNVSASDANAWYVLVKNSSDETVLSQTQVGNLAAQAFAAPAAYKVYVSSHENLYEALRASSDTEIGAAYYEGKDENVSVSVAATSTATCECGTALNARLVVNAAGFDGDINTLTVSGSDGASGTRVVTFKDVVKSVDNMSKTAYFKAADVLTYSIDYTINGKSPATPYTRTMTLDAATANTLTIVSNSNGSISLSISYDDEFTSHKTQTVTIDAATGNVLSDVTTTSGS